MTIKFLQQSVELNSDTGMRILSGYADSIAYDKDTNQGTVVLGKGDDAPGLTKNNEYHIVASALEAVGMNIGSIGGGDIRFSASRELLNRKAPPDFVSRIRAQLPAEITR